MSLSWHGGPNGLPSLPLAAILVVLATVSALSAIPTFLATLTGHYPYDWVTFTIAADRLPDGTLYQAGSIHPFRWSPVAAWLLGYVTLMPLWLWQALHLAVLPLLRVWWGALACLISYPFWFDVSTGNLMTFVAVAGVLSLRGSRPATALFLVLAVLIPRPLMFPLAAWILWRRAQWRLPFAALFVVHGAIVLASGYADAWLDALFQAGSELVSAFNFGPSALIGAAWIPVGIAFGGWLTWRGRIGLASLVASPYWLPYYYLMLLLEIVSARDRGPGVAGQRRTQTAATSSA